MYQRLTNRLLSFGIPQSSGFIETSSEYYSPVWAPRYRINWSDRDVWSSPIG